MIAYAKRLLFALSIALPCASGCAEETTCIGCPDRADSDVDGGHNVLFRNLGGLRFEDVTALGARYVDLPELFGESDIIALHAPLTNLAGWVFLTIRRPFVTGEVEAELLRIIGEQ